MPVQRLRPSVNKKVFAPLFSKSGRLLVSLLIWTSRLHSSAASLQKGINIGGTTD
jgi:hypothetical protein